MMREHVVETLEWQVGFANEEEAFETQGRLAALLRGPALDTIAGVFDEVGGGRELLALDTLEIDLGALPRAHLDAQLQERLRDRLREALRQAAGEARAHRVDAAVPRAATNRVDLLKRYLAEGYLPWQAGQGTRRRLAQWAEHLARGADDDLAGWLRTAPSGATVRWAALLRGHIAMLRSTVDAALHGEAPIDTATAHAWAQLLAWDTGAMLRLVRQHGQSARVRRRMAWHFGDALLLALVARLVPGDSDFVRAVLDEAAAFGRAQDPPVPAAQMRPRLWEFTLAYLLVERGSEFNRRAYLGSLLQQNARQDGVDCAALLQSLIAILGDATGSAPLRRSMLALLRQLADDLGGAGRAPSLAPPTSAAGIDLQEVRGLSRLGRAKLHLQAVLEGESPWDGAARRAWDLLCAWDSHWLVGEVLRISGSAAARQRLAELLGNERLLQWAALRSRDEADFIAAVALHPARLAPSSARSGLSERLWAFTLAFLAGRPGQPLDRPAYMAELLRYAAAASAASPAALPAAPAGARPGSRRWRQLALPGLRFSWRAALAAGDPASEAARAVWQELARFDREWLAEATAHHLASEAGRHAFAAQLAGDQLIAVVELLSPGAGGFVEAVTGRATALAGPALRPVAAQRRVWEFTLAWLAAERGSEFNRRSYLGALVRRSAQRDGVSEHGLLLALLRSLEAAPVSNAAQRGLLALVRELLGATRAAAPVPHEGAALALTLRAASAPALPQARAWRARFAALLARQDAPVHAAALAGALDNPAAVSRLVMLLPAPLLQRLLANLRPAQHAQILACAQAVLAEGAATGVQASAARWAELEWRFVYEFLLVQGRPFEPGEFRRRMAAWAAAQLRVPGWVAVGKEDVARTASPPPRKTPRPPAAAPVPRAEASREPIYVANAGLVLAEPFLPRLFALCGLVQGDVFIDPGAPSRAVHLLQALVGGTGPWLEHELVLNKLLCGMAIAEPLQWEGALDDKERSTVDGLLGAILQQWKVLGGTSIEGLRQTFLRREGRLVDEGEFWHLLVEPGPYDMLVDQLPWGFSTIKYPWMERMIHVQWR